MKPGQTTVTDDPAPSLPQMVRQGWAFAYRRYSTDYVADEDYARKNRLGLWRGKFRWPWEWRRR